LEQLDTNKEVSIPKSDTFQTDIQRSANPLTVGIRNLYNSLRRQLKTFENQYLACQAADIQALRTEGISSQTGIFTPLLDEVFIPLQLASSTGQSFNSSARQTLPDESFSIWDCIANASREPVFRKMSILAWGGYGKTTLLKHIAYVYSTRRYQQYKVQKHIPVLMSLRKYQNLLAQDQAPDLIELIVNYHVPSLPGGADLQVASEWVERILQKGNAIILMDGFDEVVAAQRSAIANWINQQMLRYNKSIFILASRPKAYHEQVTSDRLQIDMQLWVKDFGAEQRKAYVENWYLTQERYAHGGRNTSDVQHRAAQSASDLLTQIEARQELSDLAKNPLLLNMLVYLHQHYPGAELPKHRAELYREICQLQLKDRPATRKLNSSLTESEAQTILQMLALEMMRKRQEQIDQSALLKQLTTYLENQGVRIPAQDFLESVVQISELLVEREINEYSFAHFSFQEYLAATQIVQAKQENLLYEYFSDDWWKQTLLLYATQVNPNNLVREAMNRGATDLAYACLQQTTRQIEPALKAEIEVLVKTVQTLRYQDLEGYLKNGQWKLADTETYSLMITTLGKEEGRLFSPEELINFPCEELRAIDQLWIKYSQGKFGFSTQKQIYVECGAILDGRYPGNQIWRRFGDRVGWRINDEWITLDETSYEFSAPLGHLPRRCFMLNNAGLECYLYSRVHTCTS
ncbi:NTPase (NACHT family), partial [filamentous cyanobacterium CCP1]